MDSETEWQRFFAWRRVSTSGYITKTAWLETALRRRNPDSDEWECRRDETPEEENDRLIDFMAW